VNTLLVSLVTIAIIDSLNPTSTATTVQLYLLSTPKPLVRSASFIVGFLLSHGLAGWLIVIGFGQAIARLATTIGLLPGVVIYLLQLVIGVALIIVGWRLTSSRRVKAIHNSKVLKPSHTFLLGFGATLWKLPTAFLYLAAIEQIVGAKLTLFGVLLALVTYNLVLIVPIVSLLGIYVVFQKQSLLILNLLNRLILRWVPRIFRVILMGIGCILIVHCFINLTGFSLLQKSSTFSVFQPSVL
jgi:hypothetical protein